jgi:arylsulfatase A-like enzyme
MTIDLLPTLARLSEAPVSTERIIDGRDIWPLLASQAGATSPHDAFYFYWGAELHAIRSGNWKLHLPHPYQSLEAANDDGRPGKYVRKEIELSLFDLQKDQGETTNVAAQNPDVVKKLLDYAERAREDLGDSLTKRSGRSVRQPGRINSRPPTKSEPRPRADPPPDPIR